MKAVVAAFNQEKALVRAFSVIVQLRRLIATAINLEQAFRQVRGEALVGELGGNGEEAAEDWVEAALLHQPPGAEEGLVQGEVTLGDGGEVGVQPPHHRVHQRVPEPH